MNFLHFWFLHFYSLFFTTFTNTIMKRQMGQKIDFEANSKYWLKRGQKIVAKSWWQRYGSSFKVECYLLRTVWICCDHIRPVHNEQSADTKVGVDLV